VKILPWLIEVDETEAGVAVPKELEIALVLIAIEQERGKGGGLFGRKGLEQIVFVSKLLWPLYFLKWPETRNYVLFDGLGLFEHNFNYDTMPECEEFEKQLARGTTSDITPQDFVELLKTHSEAFADFSDLMPYSLLGCLNQGDVLRDLIPYFEMATDTDLSLDTSLSVRVVPEFVRSHVETLIMVRESSFRDIQRLEKIVKVLTESEFQWVNHIENLQVKVAEQFRQQIDETRPRIEQKVKNYTQLMQEEIASIEMRFSPLISNLQAEVPRWEREEGRWKRMGGGYEKSRDSARRAKDKAKRQLSDAIRERDGGIDKAKEYYTELIEQEWESIHLLERERDSQISDLNATKGEISKLTSHIREALTELIQRKESFVRSLNATGMSLPHTLSPESNGNPIFVYMPFWIAQFESTAEARFFVLPPSLIKKSRGMKDKLVSMFAGPALPIEPRTERFDKILKKRLQQSLYSDQSLAQETKEKGIRGDVFRQSTTRNDLERGLQLLRDTGWVTEKLLRQTTASLESWFRW